jgi:ParB family chromosome partitioning protein
VARQLSVRQVEALVARLAQRPAADTHAKVDRDVARLEEELSQRLGTTVKIQPGMKPGSGKLVIQYATLSQLDVLLRKLN